MRLSFQIAGSQIDGARDYQEDAFLITHFGDTVNPNAGSLVIVADGMGGHAAGNVAANMAVQNFNQHVTRHYPAADLSQVLRDSVQQANQAIAATVKEANVLKGMGCTLIGALMDKAGLHYASVGDSHLFLVRGGQITKTNADHSYGGYLDRMAASGQPVAADPTLTRNMLLSALTGENIMEVDCPATSVELRPGDRLLICTDGIDSLSHEEILAVSQASVSAKICVEKMLSAVTQKGVPRQDNTTVVAIDVRVEAENRAANGAGTSAGPQGYAATSENRAGKWPWVLGGLLLLAGGAWFLRDDISARLKLPDQLGSNPTTAPPVSPPTTIPTTLASAAPSPVPAQPSVPVNSFKDGLTSGGTGPELVWIGAGSFQMGSARPGADADEQPGHTVTLPKFAIMRYELTAAEYARFAPTATALPPNQQRSRYPVTMVSWQDAKRFAQWLSEQTGKKYRLPTEAEWEYAAGGGVTTPYWWGYKPEDNKAYCHACGPNLAPNKPTEIGRYPQNQFGLYDTAGNVAEWTEDCYSTSYENAPADGRANLSEPCTQRVVRGGSFGSPPKSLRTSKRSRFNPDRGYDDIGIRLVREP